MRKKAGADRTLNLNSQVMYDRLRKCSIPTTEALETSAIEPECWKKPCASKRAREERRAWPSQCPARSLPGPRPRSPSNRKNWTDTITYTMILFKEFETFNIKLFRKCYCVGRCVGPVFAVTCAPRAGSGQGPGGAQGTPGSMLFLSTVGSTRLLPTIWFCCDCLESLGCGS